MITTVWVTITVRDLFLASEHFFNYKTTFYDCLLDHSPMQCHDLQEFISLINQLITKYKEKISPFLQEVFMPVVQNIFACLNQPFDSADLEVCVCVCVWTRCAEVDLW